MSVAGLLNDREVTHGSFADNARNGQAMRAFYRSCPAWNSMPEIHREALDMMACKISRILSGQSSFSDHWIDIQGYAKLAEQACPTQELPRIAYPGVVDGNGWHPQVDN